MLTEHACISQVFKPGAQSLHLKNGPGNIMASES